MSLEAAALALAILLPALSFVAAWGSTSTRLKVSEGKLRDLEKLLKESREAQGARIGKLERWQAFLQGANSHRKPSSAYPIMPEQPEEESGRTE